jgi:hypothetical protein
VEQNLESTTTEITESIQTHGEWTTRCWTMSLQRNKEKIKNS